MKKILLSFILGAGIMAAGCGTQKIELPVDESVPFITISAPADNSVILENKLTVHGSVSDTGSGVKLVTVSGGGKSATATPDENGNFSVELTDLTEGDIYIVAQVTDEQGNAASAGVKVLIDTALPAVALTSPSAGTYKGTITLSASASDTNGIKQVEFLMDGNVIDSDTTAPYTINYDTLSTSNASHSFTARATDGAGRQAPSATVSVTVDNSAPTVTITSPANNSYVRQSITVSATASDNNSITLVEFLVDNNVFASDSTSPYSVSLDTTTLTDGPHTLTVRATDIAGNQTTSATINITVDNTAPTISITTPICGNNVCNATEAPGGVVNITITTTGVENGQTATIFSNGNPIGTGTVTNNSATISSTLVEGANALVAGVNDLAGNSATSTTVNTSLDTIAPNTSITSNPPSYTNNQDPVFGFSSTESGTFECQIDTGGYSPCSSPKTYAGLIEGSHTFYVRAIDSAGNIDSTSASYTWTIDLTPPTVTITSPAPGQLFKSSCPGGTDILCQPDNSPATPLFQTSVTVTVSDNLASQAEMAGNTLNIYSNGNLVGSGPLAASGPTTISVSLRDGGNALTATLPDEAGNTGSSSVVKTYTFVGEPGTISGGVYNRCTYSAVNGAIVELALDPQYNTVIARATTNNSGSFTLMNVPPGEYLNIRACLDRDGNGSCELKNGYGTDGLPGVAGTDDDGNGTTDDCDEYQDPPFGDDATVDFIGFYLFSYGYGPVQVRPGEDVLILSGYIDIWTGNPVGTGNTCTITGQINDSDSSWGGVNTIIATLDWMGYGDSSPVNVRSFTSVSGGTTPQPFRIYEQDFAPTDGWNFINGQFLLAAGKDLNSNGRLDLNSEPFTMLSPAYCNSSGFNLTLPPRADIQGTVYGYTPGWVITSATIPGGGGGNIMSGSATVINPDGTYQLTLFGNNTYIVMAVKDRNGFYLDQNNELTTSPSILTVGTGTIGGVNISLPPVRTIEGTVSGSGISNWAVSAGAYNNSMRGWIEPGSNYYLLEVTPAQYWLNAFNDRNANLDIDPREGQQNYGQQVDVVPSSASGINIAVMPDIQLRNVFIDDPAPGGDADRLPEPNETVNINVQFRNYRANATNVNATLSCITNCTGITINAPNPINYPNIDFDILTSPAAYSVAIANSVVVGTEVTFAIDISDGGSYTNHEEFSITVGLGHRDGTPPQLPTSGIPVLTGTNPRDVAIAVLGPFNQKAYVANYNSQNVTVINALTNVIITTITLTGCPSTVSASTDGTRVYVGNDCNGDVAVIDTSADNVTDTYNVGPNAYGVAVSPDGTELWVTNSWNSEVDVIDTSTGSIVEEIPLANWPREITFSPDGEQVFVNNGVKITVFDARERRIQRNIPNVYFYDEIAVDPYNLYFYGFDWFGNMHQVDIDTYDHTLTNFVGINVTGSLAITPDGALLYFAENQNWGDDNNVYVIDIPTLSLVGSFASGTATNRNSAIAFTAAGNKCWVTNYYDNTATPAQ